MTNRIWTLILASAGLLFISMAVWAALDAQSFAETVADFGSHNDHLVHDFAASSATFGAGLLLAITIRAWRTPALALAATWSGLHAASHIADMSDARPEVVGPVEAALLLAMTAALAYLARLSSQEER